jgi:flagellar basal body-associated protein FliL
MNHKQEALTERKSIRFTTREIKLWDELAERENERKTSSLMRRVLIAYLKEKMPDEFETKDGKSSVKRQRRSE